MGQAVPNGSYDVPATDPSAGFGQSHGLGRFAVDCHFVRRAWTGRERPRGAADLLVSANTRASDAGARAPGSTLSSADSATVFGLAVTAGR